LSRLRAASVDGRVKRIILESIEAIESGKDDAKPGDDLKDQVEKLALQVRDLSDRVGAQSAATPPAEPQS
jgi:hypothetical protein